MLCIDHMSLLELEIIFYLAIVGQAQTVYLLSSLPTVYYVYSSKFWKSVYTLHKHNTKIFATFPFSINAGTVTESSDRHMYNVHVDCTVY